MKTIRWLLVVMMSLVFGTSGAFAQRGMQQRGSGRGEQSASDWIARLDADGDGNVSKTEFDGPAEHFSKLDKNADGYIAATEVPSGPMNAGNFIDRLDQDNDGQVSRDEFDGPDNHFDKLDRDGSGYLTEDEAPKGPPPGMNGNRQRGGQVS